MTQNRSIFLRAVELRAWTVNKSNRDSNNEILFLQYSMLMYVEIFLIILHDQKEDNVEK
jgi:hypothetical protein